MPSVEQAILLCGGFGTRLRGLFPDVPKALVPVAGKTILQRQIEWLQSLGVRRVHIAAGYKADAIKAWCDENSEQVTGVSVSVEPEPLGTAGGTRYAAERVPHQDRFLVLNGDSLLPSLKLEGLCDPVLTVGYAMTMAVTRIDDASRYGTVTLEDEDEAGAFREKDGEPVPGWVNAGIYWLGREVLDMIPDGKACSIEKDVFPSLAARRRIKCLRFDPPLLDMGTPDGHRGMTDFLAG